MNIDPDAPATTELSIPKPKREFGALRGRIGLGPEFFEPLLEEELALWEGGGDQKRGRNPLNSAHPGECP